MADLNPLIRVRKHAIEQKQKFLADLYRQSEALAEERKKILDQLELEKQKIADMGAEMLGFFGHYSESVKTRVEEIDQAAAKLEVRIRVAQDEMQEAFAELKKIELIQERRDEEEAEALLKKENQTLGEIGIDGFRRRAEEEGR